MKKRVYILGLSIVGMMTLTSCDILEYIIPYLPSIPITSEVSSSSSSGGKTSSNNQTSQTSTSIIDSVPPVEGMEKTKLSYTYYDYCQNNAYSCISCPNSGSPNILVLPIWFTDSSSYIQTNYKENVRSDIEKSFFGTNEETGWRSVKSYYEELSQGKLTFSGKVAPWYSCNKASKNATESYCETIMENAVTNYFSTSGESRSDYDLDKDGYLDAVIFIYGAADCGENASADENLWAYTYWMSNDSDKSNPQTCVYMWCSYDFMYNSTKAQNRAGTTYGAGKTSHCELDAHTFIHEMGHVLGLEDYYDYSGSYSPAATFSMQDCNIGSHDPFSVMAQGWADPYIPTGTTTIKIGDFQSTHDLILLSENGLASKSPFDEYLLLELFTPTGLNKFDCDYAYDARNGYPQGPKAVGIRLWHVDARLTYPTGATATEYTSWSKSLTTNPKSNSQYGVYHANSNTYYSSDASAYCSVLGNSYYDFNILQLIGCSTEKSYRPNGNLSAKSLFQANSTFTISSYAGCFKKSGMWNSNTACSWSFIVNKITTTGDTSEAEITVVKN